MTRAVRPHGSHRHTRPRPRVALSRGGTLPYERDPDEDYCRE